uniref:Uncharacterized protein n=1 Tax=Sinocyclocheilus anshuiensis TaxID=1608454 RepID=A0A671KAU4_9TELE
MIFIVLHTTVELDFGLLVCQARLRFPKASQTQVQYNCSLQSTYRSIWLDTRLTFAYNQELYFKQFFFLNISCPLICVCFMYVFLSAVKPEVIICSVRESEKGMRKLLPDPLPPGILPQTWREDLLCHVVEHASSHKPIIYYWDPSLEDFDRNKLITGAAGLVLGAVIADVGLIYCKKCTQVSVMYCDKETASFSVT